MSAETGAQPEAAAKESPRDTADTQLGAALAAGVGLIASLRRIATAVAALLAAEARVLRASVALVFMAGVALIALAVSLWACVVALVGWGIAVASGSPALALGSLVVLHVLLLVAIWLWIKRAIHRASFPAARAELHALGRELRRDVARFQHAQPAPPPRTEPGPR